MHEYSHKLTEMEGGPLPMNCFLVVKLEAGSDTTELIPLGNEMGLFARNS